MVRVSGGRGDSGTIQSRRIGGLIFTHRGVFSVDPITKRRTRISGKRITSGAGARVEAKRILERQREIEEAKRKAELERQRKFKERQQKLQEIKEAFKERQKKVRLMSFRQRKQFARQQAELRRAVTLQRLQDQGRRISLKSKALLKKVQERFIPKEKPEPPIPTPTPTLKKEPINIFALKTWKDFGEALLKSKSQKDRNLGQKILTEPLLFTQQFVTTTIQTKDLPVALLMLIKEPSNIKKIPSNIKTGLQEDVQLIKTAPFAGLGRIGGYIFTFRIIGGVIRLTGKVTSNVATRVSPKFVGVAKTGGNLKIIGTGAKRKITLRVVGRIPTESISSQLRRAGTRVYAISSQADALVGLIRRKRIIRKPLFEESKLTPITRKLLKKFDKRKITSNELIRLDRLVQKQGRKGILERSFFADPETRVRPSRLGVVEAEKEATFKEVLSGKATLKGSKPQLLLFEDVRIQDFPKALSSVKKKLMAGKPLSLDETKKLLTWQQEVTGKFKPLGFISREAEITLAPTEVIKRVKKIGVTLVYGKRVPIISVKTIKPKGTTKSLLKKAQTGKATPKELKNLKRNLKKETGFDYPMSSLKNPKKYFSLKRKLYTSSFLSLRKRISKAPSYKRPISKKVSKGKIRYTSSGRPYITTKLGRFISPYKVSPAQRKTFGRGYYSGRLKARLSVTKTGRKIVKFARAKIPTRKKPSKVPTFNVYGKSKKKFLKLNVKPLTRDDALSRGAFAVDHTTSKTFKIIPARKVKKVGILRKSERNYFNRAGYKLREYRIRKGRKFALKNKYIERRKHGIDTRGEKRGLSLARWLKQQRTGITRRKTKRRVTPIQKKVLLKNLAKARRIKKMKGGKR